MALYQTTKLEAVNVCLTNIGEAPVASLDSGLLVDAQIASDVVDEISREVQSYGWHFNTEVLALLPDIDGYLHLPSTVLKADTVELDKGEDVIIRGTRLYDRANNTYRFTSSKRVQVVLCLDFELLPEVARRFITLRAARVFQERQLGVDSLSNQNRADEQSAWEALQAEEADAADYNMLRDSTDVGRMVSRTVVQGGLR